MWRHRPVVVVAGLAWLVAATASAADEPETLLAQPLVEGAQVFASKGCDRCHGVLASGGATTGPDLGRADSWSDVMQLAGQLWNHGSAMAAEMRAHDVEHAALSPDDVAKLSAYVLFTRFLDEVGDAVRGRDVFQRRACAQCHQFGGHGGTWGPRLDEIGAEASSLFMAQALWNHGPEMTEKMMQLGVQRPQLERGDVADIVAFVRGRRGPVAAADIAAQLGSPRAGKAIFAAKGCIKCHAIAGRGGSIGPDLAARRPAGSIGAMAGVLWNHGPSMWRTMHMVGVTFPTLSGPEMSDLLAYLAFVQYLSERGDAARGSRMFREKSCASCHDGGRAAASDLAASDAIRSSLHWAAAMWNHPPVTGGDAHEGETRAARFDDDEMRDLVAFLRLRRETR